MHHGLPLDVDEVVVVAFGLVRRCHMANSLMTFQFHMNKGKIRFNCNLPISRVRILHNSTDGLNTSPDAFIAAHIGPVFAAWPTIL